MKITVLKYGESTFEENYIFRGGRCDVKLPISFVFYLIETEQKKILVDVGCDDGAGFDMSLFQKPVLLLEDYGLKASDITDVVITHAHHDHIAAIQVYKNAVIHIQELEYRYGKKYIPDTFKVHIFDDEFLLDEQIIVRKIGGHGQGSSIVICHIGEKKYVLCGDECYVKSCFEKQIPIGSCLRPEISERFIKEYSGTDYVPLLFHDPDIIKGRIGYEVVVEQ
jgi:glyoxylase-like metal-dependent hydrolase (beta-lactamase superfamily II)